MKHLAESRGFGSTTEMPFLVDEGEVELFNPQSSLKYEGREYHYAGKSSVVPDNITWFSQDGDFVDSEVVKEHFEESNELKNISVRLYETKTKGTSIVDVKPPTSSTSEFSLPIMKSLYESWKTTNRGLEFLYELFPKEVVDDKKADGKALWNELYGFYNFTNAKEEDTYAAYVSQPIYDSEDEAKQVDGVLAVLKLPNVSQWRALVSVSTVDGSMGVPRAEMERFAHDFSQGKASSKDKTFIDQQYTAMFTNGRTTFKPELEEVEISYTYIPQLYEVFAGIIEDQRKDRNWKFTLLPTSNLHRRVSLDGSNGIDGDVQIELTPTDSGSSVGQVPVIDFEGYLRVYDIRDERLLNVVNGTTFEKLITVPDGAQDGVEVQLIHDKFLPLTEKSGWALIPKVAFDEGSSHSIGKRGVKQEHITARAKMNGDSVSEVTFFKDLSPFTKTPAQERPYVVHYASMEKITDEGIVDLKKKPLTFVGLRRNTKTGRVMGGFFLINDIDAIKNINELLEDESDIVLKNISLGGGSVGDNLSAADKMTIRETLESTLKNGPNVYSKYLLPQSEGLLPKGKYYGLPESLTQSLARVNIAELLESSVEVISLGLLTIRKSEILLANEGTQRFLEKYNEGLYLVSLDQYFTSLGKGKKGAHVFPSMLQYDTRNKWMSVKRQRIADPAEHHDVVIDRYFGNTAVRLRISSNDQKIVSMQSIPDVGLSESMGALGRMSDDRLILLRKASELEQMPCVADTSHECTFSTEKNPLKEPQGFNGKWTHSFPMLYTKDVKLFEKGKYFVPTDARKTSDSNDLLHASITNGSKGAAYRPLAALKSLATNQPTNDGSFQQELLIDGKIWGLKVKRITDPTDLKTKNNYVEVLWNFQNKSKKSGPVRIFYELELTSRDIKEVQDDDTSLVHYFKDAIVVKWQHASHPEKENNDDEKRRETLNNSSYSGKPYIVESDGEAVLRFAKGVHYFRKSRGKLYHLPADFRHLPLTSRGDVLLRLSEPQTSPWVNLGEDGSYSYSLEKQTEQHTNKGRTSDHLLVSSDGLTWSYQTTPRLITEIPEGFSQRLSDAGGEILLKGSNPALKIITKEVSSSTYHTMDIIHSFNDVSDVTYTVVPVKHQEIFKIKEWDNSPSFFPKKINFEVDRGISSPYGHTIIKHKLGVQSVIPKNRAVDWKLGYSVATESLVTERIPVFFTNSQSNVDGVDINDRFLSQAQHTVQEDERLSDFSSRIQKIINEKWGRSDPPIVVGVDGDISPNRMIYVYVSIEKTHLIGAEGEGFYESIGLNISERDVYKRKVEDYLLTNQPGFVRAKGGTSSGPGLTRFVDLQNKLIFNGLRQQKKQKEHKVSDGMNRVPHFVEMYIDENGEHLAIQNSGYDLLNNQNGNSGDISLDAWGKKEQNKIQHTPWMLSVIDVRKSEGFYFSAKTKERDNEEGFMQLKDTTNGKVLSYSVTSKRDEFHPELEFNRANSLLNNPRGENNRNVFFDANYSDAETPQREGRRKIMEEFYQWLGGSLTTPFAPEIQNLDNVEFNFAKSVNSHVFSTKLRLSSQNITTENPQFQPSSIKRVLSDTKDGVFYPIKKDLINEWARTNTRASGTKTRFTFNKSEFQKGTTITEIMVPNFDENRRRKDIYVYFDEEFTDLSFNATGDVPMFDMFEEEKKETRSYLKYVRTPDNSDEFYFGSSDDLSFPMSYNPNRSLPQGEKRSFILDHFYPTPSSSRPSLQLAVNTNAPNGLPRVGTWKSTDNGIYYSTKTPSFNQLPDLHRNEVYRYFLGEKQNDPTEQRQLINQFESVKDFLSNPILGKPPSEILWPKRKNMTYWLGVHGIRASEPPEVTDTTSSFAIQRVELQWVEGQWRPEELAKRWRQDQIRGLLSVDESRNLKVFFDVTEELPGPSSKHVLVKHESDDPFVEFISDADPEDTQLVRQIDVSELDKSRVGELMKSPSPLLTTTAGGFTEYAETFVMYNKQEGPTQYYWDAYLNSKADDARSLARFLIYMFDDKNRNYMEKLLPSDKLVLLNNTTDGTVRYEIDSDVPGSNSSNIRDGTKSEVWDANLWISDGFMYIKTGWLDQGYSIGLDGFKEAQRFTITTSLSNGVKFQEETLGLWKMMVHDALTNHSLSRSIDKKEPLLTFGFFKGSHLVISFPPSKHVSELQWNSSINNTIQEFSLNRGTFYLWKGDWLGQHLGLVTKLPMLAVPNEREFRGMFDIAHEIGNKTQYIAWQAADGGDESGDLKHALHAVDQNGGPTSSSWDVKTFSTAGKVSINKLSYLSKDTPSNVLHGLYQGIDEGEHYYIPKTTTEDQLFVDGLINSLSFEDKFGSDDYGMAEKVKWKTQKYSFAEFHRPKDGHTLVKFSVNSTSERWMVFRPIDEGLQRDFGLELVYKNAKSPSKTIGYLVNDTTFDGVTVKDVFGPRVPSSTTFLIWGKEGEYPALMTQETRFATNLWGHRFVEQLAGVLMITDAWTKELKLYRDYLEKNYNIPAKDERSYLDAAKSNKLLGNGSKKQYSAIYHPKLGQRSPASPFYSLFPKDDVYIDEAPAGLTYSRDIITMSDKKDTVTLKYPQAETYYESWFDGVLVYPSKGAKIASVSLEQLDESFMSGRKGQWQIWGITKDIPSGTFQKISLDEPFDSSKETENDEVFVFEVNSESTLGTSTGTFIGRFRRVIADASSQTEELFTSIRDSKTLSIWKEQSVSTFLGNKASLDRNDVFTLEFTDQKKLVLYGSYASEFADMLLGATIQMDGKKIVRVAFDLWSVFGPTRETASHFFVLFEPHESMDPIFKRAVMNMLRVVRDIEGDDDMVINVGPRFYQVKKKRNLTSDQLKLYLRLKQLHKDIDIIDLLWKTHWDQRGISRSHCLSEIQESRKFLTSHMDYFDHSFRASLNEKNPTSSDKYHTGNGTLANSQGELKPNQHQYNTVQVLTISDMKIFSKLKYEVPKDMTPPPEGISPLWYSGNATKPVELTPLKLNGVITKYLKTDELERSPYVGAKRPLTEHIFDNNNRVSQVSMDILSTAKISIEEELKRSDEGDVGMDLDQHDIKVYVVKNPLVSRSEKTLQKQKARYTAQMISSGSVWVDPIDDTVEDFFAVATYTDPDRGLYWASYKIELQEDLSDPLASGIPIMQAPSRRPKQLLVRIGFKSWSKVITVPVKITKKMDRKTLTLGEYCKRGSIDALKDKCDKIRVKPLIYWTQGSRGSEFLSLGKVNIVTTKNFRGDDLVFRIIPVSSRSKLTLPIVEHIQRITTTYSQKTIDGESLYVLLLDAGHAYAKSNRTVIATEVGEHIFNAIGKFFTRMIESYKDFVLQDVITTFTPKYDITVPGAAVGGVERWISDLRQTTPFIRDIENTLDPEKLSTIQKNMFTTTNERGQVVDFTNNLQMFYLYVVLLNTIKSIQ